jgi:alkylhydroperoxidase family enzyme
MPYADPAALGEEARTTLERMPVPLNVFRMMAHAETCFRPLVSLGTSILARQRLSGKLRELAILRVAQLSSARYEWTQHVPLAEALGASQEQIAALERGDVSASCFDDDERLVLDFTTEVVRDVRPRDETFDRFLGRFSPREVVELVLAVGYYMMIARLLETTGVDLEAAAGTRMLDAVQRWASAQDEKSES